ncbi:MAG: prolipoprotein diacylglyceryl transferase [Cyclobacteriaceae bacterium]|nr:prolipoprotein diacylglyceryl transferase [Cyclobacteriaceae bacterium]
MHPILFEFGTPEFLTSFLPDTMTIYSYGAMIALGALFGFLYTGWQAKKQFNVPFETTNELILAILIAAILGGKLFIVFEDPSRYLNHPMELFENFSQGFVFYGSLLFAIPTLLIFFKIKKLPILPMLDIMAITTLIVHGTGRIGCFLAGCCYGIPYDGFLSVVFTDPQCQARPLNTPLHPTQLYSIGLLFGIMILLSVIKRRKSFEGELFLLYLMLYSFGRIWIEFFRGDFSRGFIFDNLLSNSQFISLLVFVISMYFYNKLRNKSRKGNKNKVG